MKTVCSKHDRAYEVGTQCPWCEPEKPAAEQWEWVQKKWSAIASAHLQDYCGLIQSNKNGDVFSREMVEKLKTELKEVTKDVKITFVNHTDKPVTTGPAYMYREDYRWDPWTAAAVKDIQDREDDLFRSMLLAVVWLNNHNSYTASGPLAPPKPMEYIELKTRKR